MNIALFIRKLYKLWILSLTDPCVTSVDFRTIAEALMQHYEVTFIDPVIGCRSADEFFNRLQSNCNHYEVSFNSDCLRFMSFPMPTNV